MAWPKGLFGKGHLRGLFRWRLRTYVKYSPRPAILTSHHSCLFPLQAFRPAPAEIYPLALNFGIQWSSGAIVCFAGPQLQVPSGYPDSTALQRLRVDSPRLAANPSYRRRPVSRQAPNWMPDQVRHEKRQPIPRFCGGVIYLLPSLPFVPVP
jgi:hypothetical protein